MARLRHDKKPDADLYESSCGKINVLKLFWYLNGEEEEQTAAVHGELSA